LEQHGSLAGCFVYTFLIVELLLILLSFTSETVLVNISFHPLLPHLNSSLWPGRVVSHPASTASHVIVKRFVHACPLGLFPSIVGAGGVERRRYALAHVVRVLIPKLKVASLRIGVVSNVVVTLQNVGFDLPVKRLLLFTTTIREPNGLWSVGS
jgi:hypothetical protein